MAGFLIGRAFFIAVTAWAMVAAGGGPSFLKRPVGAAYVILWIVWWVLTFSTRRSGSPTNYDAGQRRLVVGSGVLLMPLLILGPPWEYSHFDGPIPRDGVLAWAGIGLFAAGIALQCTSARALGSSYTVRLGVEPGRRLVTHGPYRYVRHPIYLSYLVSMAGMSLAMGSLLNCLVIGATAAFFARRIPAEEEMLLKEYGREYADYMKATRRILPFIH